MEMTKSELLHFKNELINAMRPIEHIFKVMDSVAVDVYGELPVYYSEIGLILTENLRAKIESLIVVNNCD